MVKIVYTIENGKIKIKDLDSPAEQQELVKVYDNRLNDMSFLHMKGGLQNKTCTLFDPPQEPGIILSVQTIHRNSKFEFESANNISVSYSPVVESIQLMASNIPFAHRYDNPGSVNRLDIYIPANKVKALLPEKILEKLYSRQVLNLSPATSKFLSPLNEFLNLLIKELGKKESKTLGAYFENFIQCITL
jgi:hypothetical protein